MLKYINNIIIENCLQVGEKSKISTKTINKYIYGARLQVNILNSYDMRALILRLHPLIHNLVHNKKQNYHPLTRKWKAKHRIIKTTALEPIQILFASTTPKLRYIIKDAALFCNMPYYVDTWINGIITASINSEAYLKSKNLKAIRAHNLSNIRRKFKKTKYKSNFIRTQFNILHPTLVILPDPNNNYDIWREAKIKKFPVLSIISENTARQTPYGIIANDKSIHVVSFFCNLLAWSIKKENIMLQHQNEIFATNALIESAKIVLKKRKKITTEKKVWKKRHSAQLGTRSLWTLFRQLFIKNTYSQRLWFYKIRKSSRLRTFRWKFKRIKNLQNKIFVSRHQSKFLNKKTKLFDHMFFVKNTHSKNKNIFVTRNLMQMLFIMAKSKLINRERENFYKNNLNKIIQPNRSLNWNEYFLSYKDGSWVSNKNWTNSLGKLYARTQKYKPLKWRDNPFYYQTMVFWYARQQLKLKSYRYKDKKYIKWSFWRKYTKKVRRRLIQRTQWKDLHFSKKIDLNSEIFKKYFARTNTHNLDDKSAE